jgi:uncharacterized repeat protein (TIGR01451 family)
MKFLPPIFLAIATTLPAAPFTEGNVVIYRIGTGTGSLVNLGNPVFLDEYSPTGVLVQSVALPTVVNGAQKRLIASGTATSEGLLSRSADGRFIVVPGYDATPPHTSSLTGTASAVVNRVIGRVDGAGGIDTSTALTDAYDANNFRGATSNDGTQFWVAGNGSATTGSVRYVSALGATTSTQLSTTNNNLRVPLIFNGQLFVASGSGSTVRLGTVGTGLPTASGQTIATLPGYPVNLSPNAFFLADLDAGVVGVDTLYIADDNATSGGLLKYSFDGTTWTARGSAGAAVDGYRGLTAKINAGSVTLFSVRKGGSASTGGGELVSLTDATGSTGTLTGSPTLLVTAATNTAFRGVALSPIGFDLSMAVSAPVSAFTNGSYNYSLTVTNTGLVNVPNVSARFTLPAGVNFMSASGAGFTATHSAGVVSFSGGTVNKASTATLVVTVSAPTAGNISLMAGAAVVDPDNALNETNETNNTSTDTGTTIITDAPDLSISANAPASALTGNAFDYTLTATNNGLVNASGVDVQFTLPSGLSYVSATGAGFTISESSGVVSFSGGSLNLGASSVLTVRVTASTDGSIITPAGAAVIDPANTIAESNEGNNTSAALPDITVLTSDLTITNVSNGPLQAGESVSYTIAVSNVGTGATQGLVTVSQSLPTGLTATSMSGTGWTIVSGIGNSVSATRSDSLPNTSSYPPLTLTCDIALNSPTSIESTVMVSGGSDNNGTNNSATDTDTVAGAGPGVIQFAAPPPLTTPYIIVNEDVSSGTVIIPLTRTAGRTGAVSVLVSTVNDTATAPQDFQALSGTVVNFADNQISASVSIPLVSDTTAERNEDFRVTLSTPAGGATLGSRVEVAVRILEPDAIKPKLTLEHPKNGATILDRSPASVVDLSVLAKDFSGTIQSAEVSINNGAFVPLTLVGIPPDQTRLKGHLVGPSALPGTVAGTNTLRIRASDYRGNTSEITSSFKLVRTRSVGLAVLPNASFGSVKVSPNDPLVTLTMDKTYTFTAQAKPGKVFDHWSSPQLTLTTAQAETNPLSFTVTQETTLTAHFIDTPFANSITGEYNGLIKATGATTASNSTNGFIKVAVTPTGGFSGSIRLDGLTLPVIGRFDNDGIARFGGTFSSSTELLRVGKLNCVLALTLDMNTQRIAGTLGLQDRTAVLPMSILSADRRAFDGKTPATTAEAALFNIALPSQAQTNGLLGTQFPQGAGFGTLQVSKQGMATLKATLADGTRAISITPLSRTLTIPLFTPLYRSGGSLGGLATIDDTQEDTDVTAALWWFKPFTGGQHYPHGWREGVTLPLIGTVFTAPIGESVLPDLASPSGANAKLNFSQGKLTSEVKKEVNVSITNIVTKVPVTDASFDLKVTTATGGISGQFTHTDGTKTKFGGIILNKGENRRAFGHFLTTAPKIKDGTGQSGDVLLITKFNPRPTLVISEIMSKNASTIADDDGAFSDWLEIYNPGTADVSLLDWYVTDNASNLTKWRFPDVTLGAKQFLLLWASSKNRRTPGQPLHTNFSLSADGEYLGLVRPDGVTIEHQFAPTFPAMVDDESYGINFTGSTLAAKGAAARYRVPTDDSLATTWTSRTFNDSAWSKGKTGIGFGINVPGFKVRHVAAAGSFGGVNSIATADALLALPAGNAGIASETTVIAPVLNFLGDGSDGRYDDNTAPPNGLPEPYAIKATGTIIIPTSGSYVFGLNSDDGGRIRIDGVDVMVDDSNHGTEDHLSNPVTLTAGSHSVEIIMWEGGGGDALEFFAAAGTETSWSSNFKLVGSPGGLVVSTPPLGSSASPEVATNVQSRMLGINPGCFVRVPFTVTGIGRVSALTLRMRYNDGFIAYLNGVEVARRNAPASALFNSTATASRTGEESLIVENIDISTALTSVVNGTNVLAVHGMNDSVSNSSFLVLPEVTATLGLAGDPVFFSLGNTGPTATPGTLNNSPQFLGRVADTKFSKDRGFYDAAFSLAITTATPGATIRYTLDGSTPTTTRGTVYTKPLTLAKTRVVRAIAYRTGWESSDVDTQSYFFLNDVIRQSVSGARPGPGWPSGTINGQVANYGMDPQIVNNTNPELGGVTKVKEALMAIPSVSIVTDLPNMFDPTNGIWVNPGGRGFEWERPASMELIGDKNTNAGGFQINCGIRVRGGFSRSGDNPKHAFHVYFRSAYGASKLNYPLFGSEGVSVFDQLDLRTSQNYSWSFLGDGNNTFMREESSRELQGAMGQPYSRGRYYHLYINGQYWGLFNSQERTDADYGETYFGGSDADYDVVKSESDLGYITGVTDGNLDAWTDLFNKSRAHLADPTNANYFAMQGLAADGTTPTTDPVLLDVSNLIDYMLLTFWTGNTDGATSAFLGDDKANNWFGMRSRIGTQGFKFFAHDFEHSFFNIDDDRTGPFDDPLNPDNRWEENRADLNYFNPMFLHHDLLPNAEYKMRWADRVQKHLFNSGALVSEQILQRMTTRKALIDKAIIAESARWGDSKTEPAFTRADWQGAVDSLMNDFVPHRGSRLIPQLRADGLYPSFDAPTLSQFGGDIASGTEVIITGYGGQIYYTLDGSDPRLLGGAVNSAAQAYSSSTTTDVIVPLNQTWKYLADGSDQGTAWRAAAYDDASWSSGAAELGYGDGDEATTVPFVDVDAGTAGDQKNATTYFRTSVNVSNASGITSASINVKYDDALAIYINGVEAVRTSNLAANAAHNQYATSGVPDENAYSTFSINPALLVDGSNVIAAEVHQADAASSDISFSLSLSTTRNVTPTPLVLTTTGTQRLKVRSLLNSEWSALVDAEFQVKTAPDLTISCVANGSFTTGGTASYTITVNNTGTAATSGMVTVNPTLPLGLNLNSLSGSGWTITQVNARVFSASRNDILPTAQAYPPLTLAVSISNNAPAFVTTVASVSGGGEITTSNNTATTITPTSGTGSSQFKFSLSTYTMNEEDAGVQVTVLRTGSRAGEASVVVRSSNGTAREGSDYNAVNQTLVFTDAEASQTFTVGINNDGSPEPNETFTLALSDISGSAILGPNTMSRVLILDPDTTAPRVSITTPSAGSRLVTTDIIVNGTASDNKEVARVEVKLNNGVFADAGLTSNNRYTAVLTAPAGTHTVTARAYDLRGNVSDEVSTRFTYIPLRPLTLTITPVDSGTVTIAPNAKLNQLQLGTTYTLTAKPKPGFIWSHWSGPAIHTESETLRFSMTEGLAITANFVANPYLTGFSGSYDGLIQSAPAVAPRHANHGLLHLSATANGSFTGTAKINGISLPITGVFNPTGAARFGKSRTSTLKLIQPDQPALILALNMNLTTKQVTGTLSLDDRSGTLAMSTLTAARFGGPLTTASRYTVTIPARAQSNGLTAADFPQTTSTGIITVVKAGSLTLVGTLSDGTKLTATARISSALTAPLYAPLYTRPGGSFNALITVNSTTISSTDLIWFRPITHSSPYPLGWEQGLILELTGVLAP